ncbi:hypothetical protein [Bradyrhizobium lablabi]|uniref:hypothetical protein n=1 Tax=Bradyrhizobium lablabi TaxID=722472 RepID=UPI001BA85ABF|nr:hypothetical protein [Bradyrhizobium lablabi]MBR0697722.1 hypothetical protein [Bradyrhizobium lablabi]
MPISSATTVLVMLALSSSIVHAADDVGATRSAPADVIGESPNVTFDSVFRQNVDEATVISSRDRAPIGHRQPRIRDIPATTELSPLELGLRREDEILDRKITICRGC